MFYFRVLGRVFVCLLVMLSCFWFAFVFRVLFQRRTLEHCHWAHGPWAQRSSRHPSLVCRAQGLGPRAQLGCQIWAEILYSVSTEVPKYLFYGPARPPPALGPGLWPWALALRGPGPWP